MGTAAFRARGKIALYLLLPLVFALIPTRWLEAHPAPCLFRALFGVRCPGCGMTRAVSCALHGRVRDAWGYNPLVVVVAPLLAVEWLRLLAAEWRRSAGAGHSRNAPTRHVAAP